MSPTTRVGESDPTRGTAPEAITPGRYDGRVAVVTGAGSGIGRATARRLAAEGAAVACLDVAEDAIAAVAAEINEESTPRRRARHRLALRRDGRGRGGRHRVAGPRGAGPHRLSLQHRRYRRLRPHARAVAGRLGQDHRGQPDRDVPHVPRRSAGHDRARWRHHEHGVDGRHHRAALLGRLLRVERRREAAHQGPRGGVHGAWHPGQRHRPRWRGHAHHPQLRPARGRGLEAHRAHHDAFRLRLPPRDRGRVRLPGLAEAGYITGAILSMDGAITT